MSGVALGEREFRHWLEARRGGRGPVARACRAVLRIDDRAKSLSAFRGALTREVEAGRITEERIYRGMIDECETLFRRLTSLKIVCTEENGWLSLGDGCHMRMTHR